MLKEDGFSECCRIDKIAIGDVIQHLLNTIEIATDKQQTSGNDISSNAMIWRWVVHFKRDDVHLEDEERLGLPKRVFIPGIVEEIG